jgi:hypothetical protein
MLIGKKAVLSEDGKTYSITGQKISDAGFCSVFIVFAVLVMIKILLVLLLKTIQLMESQ